MSSSSLLVALLLLLVLEPFLSPEISRRGAFDVLVSGVLVAAVWTVARRRLVFLVGIGLAVPAIAGAWSLHVAEGRPLLVLSLLCNLVFLAFVVVVLLRRVLAAAVVTNDTLAAALSVYLLFGVIWAMTFALIETVHPGSFQVGGQPLAEATAGHRSLIPRFLYLSFVTLTTVGYGDVLPMTAVARRMAVLEAIVGQLYLAVLISRLIALHVAPPGPSAPPSAGAGP